MRELEPPPGRETVPSRPAREQGGGRGLVASAGAVLAAIGASLCCIGPLLFVAFGVGAGLASTFEPLRPVFTALMVLGLAIGFYTVYGPRARGQTEAADASCAPGDACEIPRSRTREKVLLWSATILAALFWSFNYWSILLV